MITLAEKLLTGSGKIAIEAADQSTYVEFVSSTPMTITPKHTNSGVTLQYSLNGTSWTPVASGATTPSANIIYFRGEATGTKSLFTSLAADNPWTFTGSTNLECNGKLDRLLQDDLGGDSDILTIDNYCFTYMFYNVTTLIKAPALPATTLANKCYSSMFLGCVNLTTAPALPATTLANNCYQSMFLGCTSLTTAPALPATTLATYCYQRMFQSCARLTTAPALPATTLAAYCYESMFYGCTRLTTAPALPATTLANKCYSSMFRSCTSLTTAPALPATTLATYCYQRMFDSCTLLKLSTTKNGIYDTAYRIPITGTGTTASNALVDMFKLTGGTFTGTPIINTTYYTENTPV